MLLAVWAVGGSHKENCTRASPSRESGHSCHDAVPAVAGAAVRAVAGAAVRAVAGAAVHAVRRAELADSAAELMQQGWQPATSSD